MSLLRRSKPDVRIEEATELSEELVAGMERLVRQLSSSAEPPVAAEVEEIVSSAATRLLLARGEDGALLGTLTLVLFRIPTGARAWIEDVVVDSAARKRGVGEALTHEALRLAADHGARTVDLTSRPTRADANRLYRRLGFKRRETIVYRHSGS